MVEDNKKVIEEFIGYLNSDDIKYSFDNHIWSYDTNINDFIEYCYDYDIVMKYDDIEERNELLIKDIEEMTLNDIRKYLYILIDVERCHSGVIKKNIDNGKLALTLKIFLAKVYRV